jgi:mitochondrial fission protein ELM1
VVLDAQSLENRGLIMTKALILSDQKPGHLNQSISLARLMGWEYDVFDVRYKSRSAKTMSYLYDRLLIRVPKLYENLPEMNSYELIISAGSDTFYANKILASNWKVPNLALLYPRGYRLNFSHIFCPDYDRPRERSHITALPVSLSCIEPNWYREKAVAFIKNQHQPQRASIGIVIGGTSGRSKIDPHQLREQIATIFEKYPEHEHWVTTSRRTAPEIDALLQEFPFEYRLIWSQNPHNPLPAFIELCEQLYITADSASMISEAVSYGNSSVTAIETQLPKKKHKLNEFIHGLIREGYLNDMDTVSNTSTKKIDIKPLIKKALQELDSSFDWN